MDLVRGLTSNAVDTANAILLKKLKVGDHDDPFRPHSTRDIDDSLEQLLGTATHGKINAHACHIFMMLAGERGSRASGSDEMRSEACQRSIKNFEKFMLLQKFTAPKQEEGAAATSGASTATASSAKADPIEPVETAFDDETPVAIAARGWATAIRFYGEFVTIFAARNPQLVRRAIYHLNKCIDNWRPGPGHLTTAHAILCEVCLKTHHAFSALPRLEEAIYDIEPNVSGINVFDYCDFYYYGGLCYASLQRYGECTEMLEQVLLAPAKGLSMRAVAAAKAHLLVTCVSTGEGVLPQHMRMGRHIQEICRDYVTFCEHLQKAINARQYDATTSFNLPNGCNEDGFNPLAILAVHSVPKHRAANLTATYLTVSLKALAETCGNTESFAEARIRDMVLNRKIDCTIDRNKNVVVFRDVEPEITAEQQEDSEQDALKRVMEVNKALGKRQDLSLVHPGHVLSMTPNLSQALEATKKEMDSEKGGILGAFRR